MDKAEEFNWHAATDDEIWAKLGEDLAKTSKFKPVIVKSTPKDGPSPLEQCWREAIEEFIKKLPQQGITHE
jgi:hypothetical protein